MYIQLICLYKQQWMSYSLVLKHGGPLRNFRTSHGGVNCQIIYEGGAFPLSCLRIAGWKMG